MALDVRQITMDCHGYSYALDDLGRAVEDANGEAVIVLPEGAQDDIERRIASLPTKSVKTPTGGKKEILTGNLNDYKRWRNENGFTSHLTHLA